MSKSRFLARLAMRSIEIARESVDNPNRAEAEVALLRGAEPILYLPVLNMEPATFDRATVALTQWVSERFDQLDPKELAEFLVFGCTWQHDRH